MVVVVVVARLVQLLRQRPLGEGVERAQPGRFFLFHDEHACVVLCGVRTGESRGSRRCAGSKKTTIRTGSARGRDSRCLLTRSPSLEPRRGSPPTPLHALARARSCPLSSLLRLPLLLLRHREADDARLRHCLRRRGSEPEARRRRMTRSRVSDSASLIGAVGDTHLVELGGELARGLLSLGRHVQVPAALRPREGQLTASATFHNREEEIDVAAPSILSFDAPNQSPGSSTQTHIHTDTQTRRHSKVVEPGARTRGGP